MGDARHRLLAVIPVHGHDEMTHALLGDLARERHLVDVVIVDNRGDYQPAGGEEILRPGRNLGWAGGTNFGTIERRGPEHEALVWLNNDTRLSSGFLQGLLEAWEETGAGLLGPVYDCFWRHQRAARIVPVDRYRPRPHHYEVPFVDGTCMFVPVVTADAIGLLDADTFSPVGWGAEIDYGLRARAAGLAPTVTGLSYLHHEKSVTGVTVFEGGLEGYPREGYPVQEAGLTRKWGEAWRMVASIDATTGQTPDPPWAAGWRAQLRRGWRRAPA